MCCFVYRKGTIFQANHNDCPWDQSEPVVVLYTAKVRFFKQITTTVKEMTLFFSCFVYRKGTIFQANHNENEMIRIKNDVVLYTAKVRFFKQITTKLFKGLGYSLLFCIPQRYDFSSKSQLNSGSLVGGISCFVYRKGTIFQANHNLSHLVFPLPVVVLYTAKVRFFKQITTLRLMCLP